MDRYELLEEVDIGGYRGGYVEEEEEADLEYFFFEEVFVKLKITRKGLSIVEVEIRIKFVGSNKLEEYKENRLLKFLLFMWNFLLWVMEIVVVMVLILDNGDG